MRLIEFNALVRTRACRQKNQREDVDSPVASPHDCHAVKEETISNKYLGKIQADADEAIDDCRARDGQSRTAIQFLLLLGKCLDDSDATNRDVLNVAAGFSNRLGGVR